MNTGKDFTQFLQPEAPIITMLVDVISLEGNYGSTIDMDKIEYNIGLLEKNFGHQLAERLQQVQRGVATVFPAGRFVTILQVKADQSEGNMTFMDFHAGLGDTFLTLMRETFPPELVDMWYAVWDEMRRSFGIEHDRVILQKPDLQLEQ